VIERLPEFRNLKAIQIFLSGYDWIKPYLPDQVVLCNARGSRDVAVSEWVMGGLLGFSSGVLGAVARQSRREWLRPTRHELSGTKVVIVGMGPIGMAIAGRCEAFGIEVVGFARSARGSILSVTDLPDHLGDAVAVILITPLTDETRGMFDASMLARMRDGAVLINAGRGAVVDLDALTDEVATGRLRAVLDVFDPEPLSPENRLWGLEGSFISPHLGGATHEADTKALLLAGEQVTRYAKGEALEFIVATGGTA
jgi:phosphoglycerate dehydrogenase-like enzyme